MEMRFGTTTRRLIGSYEDHIDFSLHRNQKRDAAGEVHRKHELPG